jgi:hypothetical protein
MPLGIDDPSPRFSWQLQDPARGARQTAYELLVASSVALLQRGKADLWDSGRIESGQSLNLRYAGPPVAPSTRYFWRVKVWGAEGKLYPGSAISWWETGLLKPQAWQAQWIGFETAEENAVRHAPAIWIANPDAKSLYTEKAQEAGKAPQQRFAYRLCAEPHFTSRPRRRRRRGSTERRCLRPSPCRHGGVRHGRSFSAWTPPES